MLTIAARLRLRPSRAGRGTEADERPRFAPPDLNGGTWDMADLQFGTGGDDAFVTAGTEKAILIGFGGNDTPTGGPEADVLSGGEGDGTLGGGGGGCDTLDAGSGNDLAFSEDGDDNIGGPDNAFIARDNPTCDLVFGDESDDIIGGNTTADTIKGGTGNDVVTGNGGADAFLFRGAEATRFDITADLNRTDDTVRLVGFDAGSDPLAHLNQTAEGTVLDLGDGDQPLFFGSLIAEFTADNFVPARPPVQAVRSPPPPDNAAWAAASRATGTR